MKRFLFSSILLVLLSTVGLAQEKTHKNIQLNSDKFSSELVLNTTFNQSFTVGYSIFKTAIKQKGDRRLDDRVQIQRGDNDLSIDISSLPKGEYVVELYTKELGRIYRTTFIKE